MEYMEYHHYNEIRHKGFDVSPGGICGSVCALMHVVEQTQDGAM